ncbi:MAG: hypothetical protein NZM12_07045, partial [Steroidobacteraceae bacterium]|nr:hypothetical protein [Steroidobacteraceae bacterium]MDW8260732.1 hypothetical protein [Gammaproteobacteria bacterium]
IRTALIAALACVALSGCATSAMVAAEPEPLAVATEESSAPADASANAEAAAEPPDLPADAAEPTEEPIAAADPTAPTDRAPTGTAKSVPEVVVSAQRGRHELIRDLVAEARNLLRDVELRYVFIGKGRRETLRGRPVAFALWSEATSTWTVAHLEIPRPPVRWRPGGRPLRFTVHTPGITARHVKGSGAERLMFAFARGGEPLRVYGRKFPVFDEFLVARKRWRAAVATAKPIVYLPFTEDTLDPRFVDEGREFLRRTASDAIAELRAAQAPSLAYPGELLADVVPVEVVMTLAVIEQTDDGDYRRKGTQAFAEVLSQYGLKREEAYRYSISRAKAIGPMQFTNRRGNGTYALVVRRCPAARLDPDFERGATNLFNAMKAAICLLDLELAQMPAAIRAAYRDNKKALGIFPVAAYNGGPRNVFKLLRVVERMRVDLADLRVPTGYSIEEHAASCPCLWRETPSGIDAVTIPRYNQENRWYIEKYQSILSFIEDEQPFTALN